MNYQLTGENDERIEDDNNLIRYTTRIGQKIDEMLKKILGQEKIKIMEKYEYKKHGKYLENEDNTWTKIIIIDNKYMLNIELIPNLLEQNYNSMYISVLNPEQGGYYYVSEYTLLISEKNEKEITKFYEYMEKKRVFYDNEEKKKKLILKGLTEWIWKPEHYKKWNEWKL